MHLQPVTISSSEGDTRLLGSKIASLLKEGDVVAVYGELGSGKTQIIKGICSEFGVGETVNSPTFIIVNEYISARHFKIFHFDFYRMRSTAEIIETGFKDYLKENAVFLIEWPELAEGLLPENSKKIIMSHHGKTGNERLIRLENFGV